MQLRLVKLTKEYETQLTEMMDEWTNAGENIVPYAIRKNDYHDFEKYLAELEVKEPRDGMVPDSTYFCLDEERNIFVGAVNIRHYLSEGLLLNGGHIGDGVRPSERRKGIATRMIALALEECKKLGLHKVLMVCDKDNVGSAKSIINNGGILENEVVVDGVTEQRYWITLSKLVLEEFDYSKEAVINPWNIYEQVEGMPEVVVSCFANTTFERMLAMGNDVEIITYAKDAANTYPVYKMSYEGAEIGLMNLPVGAAGTVGCLEDLFQFGAKKVVIFGTCGVLDEGIKDCSVIVPNRAVRDEGASFHYAPPSNEIAVNVGTCERFVQFLEELGCNYTKGKVWTTDGFYRETVQKVARRKEMGCVAVDMECASVAAVSQFRNKQVLQFFYAADVVSRENWDKRSLNNQAKLDDKDKIAWLALEFARQWA